MSSQYRRRILEFRRSQEDDEPVSERDIVKALRDVLVSPSGQHQNLPSLPIPGATEESVAPPSLTPPMVTPLEADASGPTFALYSSERNRFLKEYVENRLADGSDVDESMALSFLHEKILAPDSISMVEREFWVDFITWTLGKPRRMEDIRETYWLRPENGMPETVKNLAMRFPSVSAFHRAFSKTKFRFTRQLKDLEITGPTNLVDAYLYYKYIVRKANANFLDDIMCLTGHNSQLSDPWSSEDFGFEMDDTGNSGAANKAGGSGAGTSKQTPESKKKVTGGPPINETPLERRRLVAEPATIPTSTTHTTPPAQPSARPSSSTAMPRQAGSPFSLGPGPIVPPQATQPVAEIVPGPDKKGKGRQKDQDWHFSSPYSSKPAAPATTVPSFFTLSEEDTDELRIGGMNWNRIIQSQITGTDFPPSPAPPPPLFRPLTAAKGSGTSGGSDPSQQPPPPPPPITLAVPEAPKPVAPPETETPSQAPVLQAQAVNIEATAVNAGLEKAIRDTERSRETAVDSGNEKLAAELESAKKQLAETQQELRSALAESARLAESVKPGKQSTEDAQAMESLRQAVKTAERKLEAQTEYSNNLRRVVEDETLKAAAAQRESTTAQDTISRLRLDIENKQKESESLRTQLSKLQSDAAQQLQAAEAKVAEIETALEQARRAGTMTAQLVTSATQEVQRVRDDAQASVAMQVEKIRAELISSGNMILAGQVQGLQAQFTADAQQLRQQWDHQYQEQLKAAVEQGVTARTSQIQSKLEETERDRAAVAEREKITQRAYEESRQKLEETDRALRETTTVAAANARKWAADLDQAKKELAQDRELMGQLEGQVKILSNRKDQAAEVESLRRQIRALQEAHDQKTKAVEELENRVQQKDLIYQNMEQAHSERINKLQEALQAAQAGGQNTEELRTQLREAESNHQKELKARMQQLDDLRLTVNQYADTIRAFEANARAARDADAQMKQVMDEMKSAMARSGKAKGKLEIQVEKLLVQVEDERAKSKAVSQTNLARKTELNDLNARLREVSEQRDQIQSQLTEAKEQLRREQESRGQETGMVQNLNQTLVTLNAKLEVLESSKSDLVRQVDELTANLQREQQETLNAREQISAYFDQIARKAIDSHASWNQVFTKLQRDYADVLGIHEPELLPVNFDAQTDQQKLQWFLNLYNLSKQDARSVEAFLESIGKSTKDAEAPRLDLSTLFVRKKRRHRDDIDSDTAESSGGRHFDEESEDMGPVVVLDEAEFFQAIPEEDPDLDTETITDEERRMVNPEWNKRIGQISREQVNPSVRFVRLVHSLSEMFKTYSKVTARAPPEKLSESQATGLATRMVRTLVPGIDGKTVKGLIRLVAKQARSKTSPKLTQRAAMGLIEQSNALLQAAPSA